MSDAITYFAWAWRTGRIDMGTSVPDGAIQIAAGPKAALREAVGVVARHGKGESKGVWLVPGVPEAEGEEDAITALGAFLDWCAKSNEKPHRKGVLFSHSPK